MTSFMRAAVAAASMLLPGMVSAQDSGLSLARSTRIDAFVSEALRETGVPGAAVTVVKDGRIVFAGAYGRTGLDADDPPVTLDSPFGTGSVGKTFTATLVLALAQEGLLDLDAPVRQYLPGFRLKDGAGEGVTVRDLLTMRSGLGPLAQRLYHRDGNFDAPASDIVSLLAEIPLEGRPGQDWTYSNFDFVLLGQIIEAVTGQSFAAAMQERVFDPLGMERTTFSWTEAESWGQRLHRPWFGIMAESPADDMPASLAAAGLVFSTAEDMARYALAQLPGSAVGLLDPETLEMAHAPAVEVGGGLSFGLGWMVREDDGIRHPYYEGGGSGMSSGLYLFPEENMAVIAMFNAAAYPATWAIGRGVAQIVQGEEPAPLRPVLFQRVGTLSLLFMGLSGVTILIAGLASILPTPRRGWRLQRVICAVLALAAIATLGSLFWAVAIALPSAQNPMSEFTALPFRSTWHGWPAEWAAAIALVGIAAAAVLLAAGWKFSQLSGRAA